MAEVLKADFKVEQRKNVDGSKLNGALKAYFSSTGLI